MSTFTEQDREQAKRFLHHGLVRRAIEEIDSLRMELADARVQMTEAYAACGSLRARLTEAKGEADDERRFIEEIEEWLGADCHGGLGTGIHGAINRHAAERDTLRSEVERIREALQQVQWCSDAPDPEDPTVIYRLCPLCDQSEWRGHSPDCLIGGALEPKP